MSSDAGRSEDVLACGFAGSGHEGSTHQRECTLRCVISVRKVPVVRSDRTSRISGQVCTAARVCPDRHSRPECRQFPAPQLKDLGESRTLASPLIIHHLIEAPPQFVEGDVFLPRRKHPDVPERILERSPSVAIELIGHRHQPLRSGLYGAEKGRVDIGNVKEEWTRGILPAKQGCGRFTPDNLRRWRSPGRISMSG